MLFRYIVYFISYHREGHCATGLTILKILRISIAKKLPSE